MHRETDHTYDWISNFVLCSIIAPSDVAAKKKRTRATQMHLAWAGPQGTPLERRFIVGEPRGGCPKRRFSFTIPLRDWSGSLHIMLLCLVM